MTKDEATALLTLVDIALRTAGMRLLEMPGGLVVIDSACRKLEQAQNEVPNGNDNTTD